jgi:hypothetical protein
MSRFGGHFAAFMPSGNEWKTRFKTATRTTAVVGWPVENTVKAAAPWRRATGGRGRRLVLVVLLRLVPCRSFRVLGGNEMMAVRKMGVMFCFFVGTSLMVFGCLPMMTGSVFVMFGRLLVMLRTFMFGHFSSAPLFQNIQLTYRLFVPGECVRKC